MSATAKKASEKIKAPRGKPSARRSRPGRPTREQAERRHTELLDRALDIFLDRGYEQTTMETLAAAVRMTKRTVYALYEDKAALFKATVRRAIEAQIVARDTLRALETDDLEATLKKVARLRIQHLSTPAGVRLQRIINAESYRFPEIFTMSYDLGARPVIEFLTDLLRRGEKRGTVRVSRPDLAALAFMSLVVGGPARLIASGNPPTEKEIEERVAFTVRLFLNGVRSR